MKHQVAGCSVTTENAAHGQGGDREERIVFGDQNAGTLQRLNPSGGHDRKEEACLDLGQALCGAEKIYSIAQ